MIFRSNLTCPDLTPHFKHLVSRPMGHSFGHDVLSDWADKDDGDPVFGQFKQCGLWTHDEAAILCNVARASWALHGLWVDIGAHTGWTSRHINEATNSTVMCVEPMLAVPEFSKRFHENNNFPASWLIPEYSDEYLSALDCREKARGFVIDGCHEDGQPQRDAANAARHLADTGVIMFHDGVGRPVRKAVELLMAQGFKARAYFTPYLVFCCWRGDFTPPEHRGDPEVKRQMLDGRFKDFDFSRCE